MIFKNIVLLSALLVVTTSLIVTSVHATEQIDQSFTGPFDSELLLSGQIHNRLQVFTPSVDNISALDLYLNDRYDSRALVTVTAKILDNPTQSVIGQASTTVDVPTVIGSKNPIIPIQIHFDTPISLTSGEFYLIEVSVSGELDGPTIAWKGSTVDYYPGGRASGNEGDIRDYGFTTYYEVSTPPVIPPTATVGSGVTIGDGTVLGENVIVNQNTVIGENVIVGENTAINKDVVVGDNTTIGEDVTVNKDVTIGNGVTIGDNVIIGKDVIIGDNAVIGNNVVIGKNAVIAPNAVVPDGTLIPNNGTFP